MNHELDAPQTCFNCSLNFEPQSRFTEFLLDWAKTLPQTDRGILDLAAGYGIEAKELMLQGFPCQAQDPNPRIIDNAFVRVSQGTAEDLSQYSTGSFGGALLKDALIALSPHQRIKMFEGLNKILVSNGSLLVSSEILTKYEISYQTPGVHGYSNTSCQVQDLNLFFSLRQKLIRENATIRLISYKSIPEDFQSLALNSGFEYELIENYPATHPLALENRWIKTAGFIAKLTKSS